MDTISLQGHQDKLKILFVEDDIESTELFVNCFDDEYQIITAGSAQEALEIFRRESDIAMVLSDQSMPNMSGVELLTLIYELQPDTIRIIITGYIEISDTIDAINKGHIYQFILKPWEIVQVRIILSRAANAWKLTRENRLLQEQVLEQNCRLTDANERLKTSEKNLRKLSIALLSAREDEQKRIAIELHDELGQSLAALKMQIRVMEHEFQDHQQCPSDRVCSQLHRLRANLAEIIENVRRLSKNLSPVIIDDLGLDAAIKNMVLKFTTGYHVTCSFQAVPLTLIKDTDGQRIIYRLIQESLNNIGKHAQATHINFSITIDEQNITLTLVDNGMGFDVQEIMHRAPEHKGIGLTAMAERVKMLNGTMDLQSRIGHGTTLVFTIPLNSTLICGISGNNDH